MSLRKYQIEAVDAAWASVWDRKNPVIAMPTGSGKSYVIADLVRQAIEKWQGRTVLLAHRRELLEQTRKKFKSCCRKSKSASIPLACGGAKRIAKLSLRESNRSGTKP